ncbi:MBOAT, membrane-bound O-acyltransferase family-domain-containing protein [Zychaea mexicana]|uniref:MBOAT, membrane-bound O-acyltransferase family-domain-containing protein n=1 Tax=Zychaea mexicana TaxID=64656 RepID=UPI0022FF0187|nr:MBOAT, membrane-bound O-acyltransferase family-domain-containing protein [Zychaea mexicana]KAI9493896.1 MBOAT, membrane-bound O-acyltransferase family-domain-containing protein [Zychaea mexicana]
MDDFFELVANELGDQISADHIKLVACVLAAYPSALVYRRLPAISPTSRHIFSIIYTLVALVYVLKFYTGAIHIGFTAMFTYIFMKFYRSNKNSAFINFVVVMISMSICHINRQIKGFEGSSKLDYSGALMVATIKFSSFGFNVTDGYCGGAVTEYNQRMKIDHYPSLIEYFGWICFFGGFFVGPSSEFMDYYRFTNYYFLSSDKHISPYMPTLRHIVLGVAAAIVMVVVGSTYNYVNMLDNVFLTLPLYKKLAFFKIAGYVERCKFSSIWLLAEGSCILSGFGYNGIDKDGRHQWNRLLNVNWLACESAQSFKDLSNGWNLSTNNWLRHYVYDRITPPNTKPTSFTLFITYLTSAIWHGFYPGYYWLFIPFGMFQALSRRIRRVVRPLVMTADDHPVPLRVQKMVYDIMGYLFSMELIAILVVPFELLHLTNILKVWGSIYYIHVWGYFFAWSTLIILEPRLLQSQKQRTDLSVAKQR